MGQLENCKSFIDRKTYVNRQDSLGWTPIMYAARFGYLDTLKFLHSIGGSLTSKNIFDYTPLCMAVVSNCTEVFEYILGKLRESNGHNLRNETIAFELACVLGKTEFLKSFLLLEEFSDVNNIQCSIPGISPLLLTVYSGNVEVVELLLAFGAKRSQENEPRPSALDIAIYNRDDRIQALFSVAKVTPSLTPSLLTPSVDSNNAVFNFSTPSCNLEESGYHLNHSPRTHLTTIDYDFHNLDGLLSPRFLGSEENGNCLSSIENKSDINLNEVKSFSHRKYIMWMSQKINKRRTKSVNDLSEKECKENKNTAKRETDCLLTHILTELKLEKYIVKFKKNELDHFTIFTLTDSDLIAMGISKKKRAIEYLRNLGEK